MKEPRKDVTEMPESIPTTATLEEFLENDVPGYEYIDGTLVLKSPPERYLPIPTTMTAEEFLENDLPGYEYAKGELIPMSPATKRHGKISVNIIRYLDRYVYENGLGELYTAETIFQVGDRMMKPDVAFVSTDRLDVDEDKTFPIPPDLAIEVVSPTDVHYRIVRKALDYLEAGTRLVWVLDPIAKAVTVYRSESDIEILTCEATLTGEDVVPGFTCPVEQLFE